MPITINNYETYFIDYHDGALSPGQVAELFLFLEQHPRIKEEFEEFNGMQLDTTKTAEETFPAKESLKRGHITSENLSWYLVASMEQDLDAEETIQLKNFLDAHPASRRDAALFQATRLEPGSEKYDEKRDLKKPIPFTITYRSAIRYAIAAMLLLGFIGGATYFLNRSNFANEERIAQKEIKMPSKVQPQTPRFPGKLPGSVENTSPGVVVDSENQTGNRSSHQPAQFSTDKTLNDVNTRTNLADNKIIIDTVEPALILPPSEIALSLDQSIHNLPEAGALTDIKPNSGDEQYLTVWEAIRNASSKEVQRLTGQPTEDGPLAYADQPATDLVDLVGNGISKLTNEKVSYSSRSDETGRKSGFRFNLGGISIEK